MAGQSACTGALGSEQDLSLSREISAENREIRAGGVRGGRSAGITGAACRKEEEGKSKLSNSRKERGGRFLSGQTIK